MNEKRYPKELFDFEKRALSYSSIKHVLRSPAHFAEYWTAPKPPPTPALLFGGLVDCLLFTPEEMKVRYAVSPGFDRRTKEGKAGHELFQSTALNKLIVTEEDVILAKVIVERIKIHPLSQPLYESCTFNQRKLKWTDKETGLPLVGYLDAGSEIDGQTIVWDLKTAQDASDEEFQRDAGKYGYAIQAHAYSLAYIMNSGTFPDFRFVVAEKEQPFAINVFRPDNRFMEYGKKIYRKALDRIAFCYENDCFDLDYDFMCTPGYNQLSVPGWLLKNAD